MPQVAPRRPTIRADGRGGVARRDLNRDGDHRVLRACPVTTGVVNTADASNLNGLYGAVDTGGAPLEINGTGFLQAVGPVIFAETVTGTDSASQYTYDVVSDTEVTALAPAMNPDLVDVFLCSTTGCCPQPSGRRAARLPAGQPRSHFGDALVRARPRAARRS